MTGEAKGLLFLHVGWARKYQGLRGDRPVGAHDYIQEGWSGHEHWNFLAVGGSCTGYAPVKNGTINITKLGAKPSASSVDHVTVVWTASHPDGGRRIVGWYRDATVFRNAQERSKARHPQALYNVKAAERNCTLLSPDDRLFEVQVARKGPKGFPGSQSASWFPGENATPEVNKFISTVLNYIGTSGSLAVSPPARRQFDVEKRREVEDVAMNVTWDHYESLGYKMKDVSGDNVGWDLEARKGRDTLCLEVKGLSGAQTVIFLTPNEYEKVAEPKLSLRLCIVTSALDNPTLSIYEPLAGRWASGKRTLTVEPQMAAKAYLPQAGGIR